MFVYVQALGHIVRLQAVGFGSRESFRRRLAHLNGDVHIADSVGVELNGVGLTIFALHRHTALTSAEHEGAKPCDSDDGKDCLVHKSSDVDSPAKLR